MNKALLIILDGFGEGKDYEGNAITRANTPNLDNYKKNYPWTLLKASGNAVGIPEGTQGGSEVGHFTMGAGRRIFQSLEEINRSIKDKSFFKKPALLEACKKNTVHLLGMISDQGVHSHIAHLFALLELAKKENVRKVFIHAVTDGRDVEERSAHRFITQILDKIKELKMENIAKIGTIIGRYYAMDRDSNWERTKKAYDLYTLGEGVEEKDPLQAIENAYARDIKTDYYIDPIILDKNSVIKNDDAVICWNYRTDRVRQITWCFTGENNPPLEQRVHPYYVCMGPYSEKAPVVFPTPIVKNNLGEIISKKGLKQFRIAETEKYAHVTYFFNSQIEEPYPGEERLLVESKKCKSYAEKPEMSAREITEALIPKIESGEYALIVLNFANCDLVGHSGNFEAAKKAVEVVDECLGKIIPIAQKNGYSSIVTGDHGNAEYMMYDSGEDKGQPCPSHTTNPVPLILISDKAQKLKKGELDNIAPTILQIMKIEIPEEMSNSLLI